MLTIILVLAIATLLLTVAGTLRGRGRQMTAAWIAPLYGGFVLVVLGAAALGVRYTLDRDYRKCVDQREILTRQYTATLRLYDAIDILTGTETYTHEAFENGQPSLRDGLRADLLDNLPVCRKP